MLTKKEKEILDLRKKGLKQEQIATKLKISQPAVSAFENNALRKIKEAKLLMEYVKEMKIKYEED